MSSSQAAHAATRRAPVTFVPHLSRSGSSIQADKGKGRGSECPEHADTSYGQHQEHSVPCHLSSQDRLVLDKGKGREFVSSNDSLTQQGTDVRRQDHAPSCRRSLDKVSHSIDLGQPDFGEPFLIDFQVNSTHTSSLNDLDAPPLASSSREQPISQSTSTVEAPRTSNSKRSFEDVSTSPHPSPTRSSLEIESTGALLMGFEASAHDVRSSLGPDSQMLAASGIPSVAFTPSYSLQSSEGTGVAQHALGRLNSNKRRRPDRTSTSDSSNGPAIFQQTPTAGYQSTGDRLSLRRSAPEGSSATTSSGPVQPFCDDLARTSSSNEQPAMELGEREVWDSPASGSQFPPAVGDEALPSPDSPRHDGRVIPPAEDSTEDDHSNSNRHSYQLFHPRLSFRRSRPSLLTNTSTQTADISHAPSEGFLTPDSVSAAGTESTSRLASGSAGESPSNPELSNRANRNLSAELSDLRTRVDNTALELSSWRARSQRLRQRLTAAVHETQARGSNDLEAAPQTPFSSNSASTRSPSGDFDPSSAASNGRIRPSDALTLSDREFLFGRSDPALPPSSDATASANVSAHTTRRFGSLGAAGRLRGPTRRANEAWLGLAPYSSERMISADASASRVMGTVAEDRINMDHPDNHSRSFRASTRIGRTDRHPSINDLSPGQSSTSASLLGSHPPQLPGLRSGSPLSWTYADGDDSTSAPRWPMDTFPSTDAPTQGREESTGLQLRGSAAQITRPSRSGLRPLALSASVARAGGSAARIRESPLHGMSLFEDDDEAQDDRGPSGRINSDPVQVPMLSAGQSGRRWTPRRQAPRHSQDRGVSSLSLEMGDSDDSSDSPSSFSSIRASVTGHAVPTQLRRMESTLESMVESARREDTDLLEHIARRRARRFGTGSISSHDAADPTSMSRQTTSGRDNLPEPPGAHAAASSSAGNDTSRGRQNATEDRTTTSEGLRRRLVLPTHAGIGLSPPYTRSRLSPSPSDQISLDQRNAESREVPVGSTEARDSRSARIRDLLLDSSRRAERLNALANLGRWRAEEVRSTEPLAFPGSLRHLGESPFEYLSRVLRQDSTLAGGSQSNRTSTWRPGESSRASLVSDEWLEGLRQGPWTTTSRIESLMRLMRWEVNNVASDPANYLVSH